MGNCSGIGTALVAAILLSACVSGRPQETVERQAARGEPLPPLVEEIADQAFGRALRAALADPDSSQGLHLFAECQRDGGLEAVEVFASGVGIWNGRRQFRVEPGGLRQLLEALVEVDFAAMAAVYGGPRASDLEPPGGGRALAAIRIICRVEVDVGGLTKSVAQRAAGEQSVELRSLAERFFEVCAGPAADGIEAESLAQGLEMVARGELAPESLAFMLHRRAEDPAAAAARQGFLLRLDGGVLTVRNLIPFSGYEDPLVLPLAATEISEIADLLSVRAPQEWPRNLWAPDYNDFAVRVLAHERSIQARSFPGMTTVTHGERQRDFDAVVALVDGLYERALEQGVRRPMGDGSG